MFTLTTSLQFLRKSMQTYKYHLYIQHCHYTYTQTSPHPLSSSSLNLSHYIYIYIICMQHYPYLLHQENITMVAPISLQQQEDEDQNRVFYELCTMIIHILGSQPFPSNFPSLFATASLSSSPATFASLFLGISLALMVFGSVIFVIGLVLLPCVVGLVILFYFVDGVSNLSCLGRAFLSPPSSSKAWKLL